MAFVLCERERTKHVLLLLGLGLLSCLCLLLMGMMMRRVFFLGDGVGKERKGLLVCFHGTQSVCVLPLLLPRCRDSCDFSVVFLVGSPFHFPIKTYINKSNIFLWVWVENTKCNRPFCHSLVHMFCFFFFVPMCVKWKKCL